MDGSNRLNAELLVDFECIVCTEYMHPPIVQCREGHSVCNTCYWKLWNCPTCRQSFDLQCQPYVLERVHSRLLFPCKFTAKGCRVQRYGSKIQEHEAGCSHKDQDNKEISKSSTSRVPRVYQYLSLLEELADMVV